MTAGELVRSFLLTLTPVTALVNGRIWTLRWPTNGPSTFPAVLIQQMGDGHDQHLRGFSGLRQVRVQIDTVGLTADSCRAVDQAIRGGYSNGATTGLMGAAAVVGNGVIANAVPMNYLEYFEPDEKQRYRIVRDYRVWYEA